MANENVFENCGLQSNSVLKAPKPRLPLQELNNILQVEEENTTVMQARKRRVSFANVNTIKEFNAGAESLLVCHTPAYEEPFSAFSDSSNPSLAHEMVTPAKSDCENIDNNVVVPNHLVFSNYNKRVSSGSSRVSIGPDQMDSQDMEFTNVLRTTCQSADISSMAIKGAMHEGIFNTHLSLNSSKLAKTKYYNSVTGNDMELTEVIKPSEIEGTKFMNNTSFGEMEFTEMLDPVSYEGIQTVNNTRGMELTNAVSPLIIETTRQSVCNVSKARRRSSYFVTGNGRRSVFNMSENGMEFTEVIHNKIFESTRNHNNFTVSGMELTEVITPVLMENFRSMDTSVGSGMELTETLSPELYEASQNMSNIKDSGMELTTDVTPIFTETPRSMSNMISSRIRQTEAGNPQFQNINKTINNFSHSGMELTNDVSIINERTRSVSNMTSSGMELTEAINQQFQNTNKTINNFSHSGMELTNDVPIINERTRSVSNMTSSGMELTDAVNQQFQNTNKTINNFSQSGMDLTNDVPKINERTRSVSNMTSSRMELTEAANQQFQNTNKTINNFSQSGMELTNDVPKINERTRPVSNMTSSRMELTEAANQQSQNTNKAMNNFLQSGMEINERTRSVNNMTSSRMELTEAVNQQFQERNKTINSFEHSGIQLTEPLHLKSYNEIKTKSSKSHSELTEPVLSKTYLLNHSGDSHMIESEEELIDVVPKFIENTNLLSNMTSNTSEFTQSTLQKQQNQSKSVNSLTESRMELTEPLFSETPHVGTEMTESIHSKLSDRSTLNAVDEIETDDKNDTDRENLNSLNSLNVDHVEVTAKSHSREENGNFSNIIHKSHNGKSNTWNLENEILTEADFQTNLSSETNDNILKECTKISPSETFLKNVSESVHDSIKNISVHEKIVTDCSDPKVQGKEETKNSVICRVHEKSSNSTDVNRTIPNNETKGCLTIHIDSTDKKETQKNELPCANVQKLNETIHTLSKTKHNWEDRGTLSCVDQSECSNIKNCSRIDMTGITPLDDKCCEYNLVERNTSNVGRNGVLSTETDVCSINRGHNLNFNVESTSGGNNICSENIIGEVAVNVTDRVGNEMFRKTNSASERESYLHDSDVEMDLDKKDFTDNSDENIRNKSISTSVTKSCQVIHDVIDSVNGNKRIFKNDNLEEEITEKNEEMYDPIITSDVSRKCGHNIDNMESNIGVHISNFGVHPDSLKKSSVLNNTNSSVKPTENIEVMEESGDQVMNCSSNYLNFDSVSAHNGVSSNTSSKTENESHKTAHITHSMSDSIKIQNRTEISTQGNKRKYTSLDKMGTADETINPPKIYIQEQVRSNFDNNVVSDMQVTVNTDDKKSRNNEKIVTHCTLEIGGPKSNEHNVSSLEPNKQENSMLSNAGVANDDKCDTKTTQCGITDISVHENIAESDIDNDLYQTLANHSNITFRRKSKSLISRKNNRSQNNNQPSSTVDFQKNMASNNIDVVVSTEITITNITISDVNACSSFIRDHRKSNVECIKTPLAKPIKEISDIKERKVCDSKSQPASSTDRTHFKMNAREDRNVIYNCNRIQENIKNVWDLVNQQLDQTESNDVSALQQIPRDFREKWNLHEVSDGIWSLDLISDTLLLIFKIGEHEAKCDNGISIVRITYKEIYARNEDSVKSYMAKSVMGKFSTRDLKKICSNTLQIPKLVEHVNAFVQHIIETGKYLVILIDIYCAVLKNRMLTFEVCSARSRLWIKVNINLDSTEYLSGADITMENIKGNVEQSVIRKIFETVKGRPSTLYEFVSKVFHYIRIERSIMPVK